MSNLPLSYFVAIALLGALLLYGAVRLQTAWAFSFNVSLATVGAWYLVEPIYFPEEFEYSNPDYVRAAFDGVVIYFIAFAVFTPILVKNFEPKAGVTNVSTGSLSAERVLFVVAGLWLLLLAYGVFRMQGDVLGTLLPMEGRAGARMWGRAAGSGAGSSGFIVSTAAYLYTLCLAFFGVMLFLVRTGRARRLAIGLILLSWPYAFLQGSRNVTLAVVVPAMISYFLFSRQAKFVKLISCGLAFLALDFALRIVIAYRNEGFWDVDLAQVESSAHLGLNMASELVYSIDFVNNGVLQLSYGLRYLQELANVVPRALWPGKPLVGIDYAIARGFAGNSDIGVFATISSGLIGQAVQNFGQYFGPIVAALLMATWVAILTRFRRQATPLRLGLFLVGLGLTFNLGRDVTLLVLWPMVFGYLGVRYLEWRQKKRTVARPANRSLERRSNRAAWRRPAEMG
jgi:oligosaccharide repeat unit polymerase